MNFAQLMGGQLKVTSKLEQGSVFTLIVPLPACNAPVVNQSAAEVIELEPVQKTLMTGEVDLTLLTLDVVRELKAAAEALDIEKAQQVVTQIRKTNPVLATGLDTLAQGFRFDRIAELCKTAEEGA